MNVIDQFVSTRYRLLLTLAIILAVSIDTHKVLSSTRANTDDLMQIGSAVNFIEGHGFCMKSSHDLELVECRQLDSWPYFYRVVAVPVLMLTGKNVELSFLVIRIVSFTCFLLAFLYFLKHIDFRHKESLTIISVLLLSILTTPVNYGGAIDVLSVSATLLAVVFLIKYWFEKRSILNLVVCFIFLALLPQMRYAYVPVTLAFVGFFFVLHFFRDRKIQKWYHYLLLLIPLGSLLQIITSNYFTKTSSRLTEVKVTQVSFWENLVIWLKPIYAPFFNSFFPDYVILSLVKRFPFYEKIVVYLFFLFFLTSLIIFFALAKNYLLNTKAIKSLFAKNKIHETTLVFIILVNLGFYLLLYRNVNHSVEDLKSGVVLYKGLTTLNRYFVPIHLSVFILTLIYFSREKAWFLKTLAISSVLFGVVHYGYLRTQVYSLSDRAYNMNIVNLPEGSYNDLLALSSTIRNYKKESTVYFIFKEDNLEGSYRQMKPWHFAMANGAISVPIQKWNANESKPCKNCILLQSVSNKASLPLDYWDLEFEGQVYSLYIYKK